MTRPESSVPAAEGTKPPPRAETWWRRAGRPLTALAAIAAVVVLIVLSLGEVPGILDALQSAKPGWIAVSILANVLSVLVRALSWHTLMTRALGGQPPVRTAISAFWIGQAVNSVAPVRLGEPLKIGLVCRRPGVGWRRFVSVSGTVVAHRLIDAFPLTGVVILIAVSTGLPGWIRGAAWAAVGAGAVLLAVAVVLARPGAAPRGPGATRAAVAAVQNGLGALRSPAALGRAVLLQSSSWAFELVGVWAGLQAFGVSASPGSVALVVLATQLATVLPLWPGNVGIFQIGVALALAPAGVPRETGIAFGIALQAIELISALVPGVALAAAEGLSLAFVHRPGDALRQVRTGHAPKRPDAPDPAGPP